MKAEEKEIRIFDLERELKALFAIGGMYSVFTEKEVSRRIEIIDELEKLVNKKFAEKLRKTLLPREIEVGFIPTYVTLTKTTRMVNDLASPDGRYPELKNIKFPEGFFIGHKTIQCKVKFVDDVYEKYKLVSIPRRGLLMLDSPKKVSVIDVTRRRKKRKDNVYLDARYIGKVCYFSSEKKRVGREKFSAKLYVTKDSEFYNEELEEAFFFLIREVNKQFNKIAKIKGTEEHLTKLTICP
jgi:hypothetical protein